MGIVRIAIFGVGVAAGGALFYLINRSKSDHQRAIDYIEQGDSYWDRVRAGATAGAAAAAPPAEPDSIETWIDRVIREAREQAEAQKRTEAADVGDLDHPYSVF